MAVGGDELGRHRGMLYRFALFLLGNSADAEEIAQEAFRVALSKGPDPAKGANYGAWLRSIARNLVRNHVRKQRLTPLLLRDDVLALAEARFVDTGADRDEVWAARRRALGHCMEKLSEANRGLLRRRYELREPVKRMAQDLALEPNSLSKRLERIRHALRQCIEAALGEEADE